MNQGRIWCVVNPTVGLPLFLGSVAVTSLIVHYSVLSNVSWFASYWNGGAAKAASVNSANPVAVAVPNSATGMVVSVSPTASRANGEASFVITVASPAGAQTAQTDAGAAVSASDSTAKLALASPGSK
jgi:light-harvesting protein B-800-850 alpha chain